MDKKEKLIFLLKKYYSRIGPQNKDFQNFVEQLNEEKLTLYIQRIKKEKILKWACFLLSIILIPIVMNKSSNPLLSIITIVLWTLPSTILILSLFFSKPFFNLKTLEDFAIWYMDEYKKQPKKE